LDDNSKVVSTTYMGLWHTRLAVWHKLTILELCHIILELRNKYTNEKGIIVRRTYVRFKEGGAGSSAKKIRIVDAM
jgi:hypothetical protein